MDCEVVGCVPNVVLGIVVVEIFEPKTEGAGAVDVAVLTK